MFLKNKALVFTAIFLINIFSISKNIAYSETNQPVINMQSSSSGTVKTPAPKTYLSVHEDPINQLGLIHSANQIKEAEILLNEGKINEAEKIINEINDWLSDATKYHFDLFQILSKDVKTSNASKIEKAHTIDFGNLRDESSVLFAKILIKKGKQKDAVGILVKVMKSQSDSELGKKAYKMLQGIKFSDRAG
ncbi:MAG: hypothetical protein A3B68_07780 [Candidatus Melainabacteria bacterium RIFCSPHIGHO2_02_FULL_34_12]|nr:MAG: hypothetical protein A3B68_07780 [Candidatus Melainabacteria bacterium RIFCSPHIGHO2_02_FULL_34_12]